MKQNEIDTLRTQLQTIQLASNNQAQTQDLLSVLGNFYMRPPVNPCTVYTSCAC